MVYFNRNSKVLEIEKVDEKVAERARLLVLEGRGDLNRFERLYINRHRNGFKGQKRLTLIDINKDNKIDISQGKFLVDTFTGYHNAGATQIEGADSGFVSMLPDIVRDIAIFGRAFVSATEDGWERVNVKNCLPLHDISGRHIATAVLQGDKLIISTDSEYLTYDKFSKLIDRQEHVYDFVPVQEVYANDWRSGVIEPVADLIELYQRCLEGKSAEVEYFKESYLWVSGVKIKNETSAKVFKDSRVINTYGEKDAKVEFLSKPTADDTQEHLIEHLERLIHRNSGIPDINQDDFGNNSGVALAYKLANMDNLSKDYDKALERWIAIDYDAKPVFSRNRPRNLDEEISHATAIDGHVSDKTKLSLLSFVTSPEDELKELEKETGYGLPDSP